MIASRHFVPSRMRKSELHPDDIEGMLREAAKNYAISHGAKRGTKRLAIEIQEAAYEIAAAYIQAMDTKRI